MRMPRQFQNDWRQLDSFGTRSDDTKKSHEPASEGQPRSGSAAYITALHQAQWPISVRRARARPRRYPSPALTEDSCRLSCFSVIAERRQTLQRTYAIAPDCCIEPRVVRRQLRTIVL